MTSALFSKLTLASLLTIGAMSACGGDASNGADTQTGSQTGLPCNNNPAFQTCACPTGGQGYQTCQNMIWGQCTCQGSVGGATGTGGFSGGPPPGGSGPPPTTCGNGQIDPGEQCDGQNQGGETCMAFTMGACTGGYLICTGNCTFDISQCAPCSGGVGGSGGTFGSGGFPGGGTTGQP